MHVNKVQYCRADHIIYVCITGSGATEGLKADSYVKQPAGSESGFYL